MKKTLLSLSVLFFLWSTGLQGFAQEKQSTTAPAAETERPKNEVERALEEAKAHGEIIMGTCIQDCEGKPVEGGVEPGKVIELPKPNYSPLARTAHISGTVVVQVIIGLDGNVIAAAAISGHPLLLGTSVAAARNTRFTPTTMNGKPVKVVGVLQYNFVSQ